MKYVLAIAVCSGLTAQAGPKLEFEVASIKPNKSGERGMQMRMTPGHLIAKNVSVKNFIMMAFDVRDFQVSGGPSWLGTDRFDLDAKTSDEDTNPDNLTREQRKTKGEEMRTRMQSLLADRFQLKFHEDSKDSAAYALVIGKNGTKLKPLPVDEQARQQMRFGRGQLSAKKVTLDMIANQLSDIVGRPVVNKTGLTGDYDIELEWTPDAGRESGGLPPSGEAPPPVDSSGPTIFTALQEKLGLKLEGTKAPVKVIVIDSLEKPSEN